MNNPSNNKKTIFINKLLLDKNRFIKIGTNKVDIIKNFLLPIKSEIVPPVRAPIAPVNSKIDKADPETKSLKPSVFIKVGKKRVKLNFVKL